MKKHTLSLSQLDTSILKCSLEDTIELSFGTLSNCLSKSYYEFCRYVVYDLYGTCLLYCKLVDIQNLFYLKEKKKNV